MVIGGETTSGLDNMCLGKRRETGNNPQVEWPNTLCLKKKRKKKRRQEQEGEKELIQEGDFILPPQLLLLKCEFVND